MFDKWREIMDTRANLIRDAMIQAKGVLPAGTSLDELEQDEDGRFMQDYQVILENCAVLLNVHRTPTIRTLEPSDVHRVIRAFVALIEIYAEVDMTAASGDEVPPLALAHMSKTKVNKLHVKTHGWQCERLNGMDGVEGAGRTCGEGVERYNARLNTIGQRCAPCRIHVLKHYVSELMRATNRITLDKLPWRIKRLVKNSRGILPAAATCVLESVKELHGDAVFQNVPPHVVTACNFLFEKASIATLSGQPMDLQDTDVLANLNIVEAWHIQRILDSPFGNHVKPSKELLQEMIRMLVIKLSWTELAAALESVDHSSNNDHLTSAIAKEAIALSTHLSDTQPDEMTHQQLKTKCEKCGIPVELLPEEGHAWDADQFPRLVHYVALMLTWREMEFLWNSIRRHKALGNGTAPSFRMAQGNGRGSQAINHDRELYVNKAKQYKLWVIRFNYLIPLLEDSLVNWSVYETSVLPPVPMEYCTPEIITDSQRDDVNWLPFWATGITSSFRAFDGATVAWRYYKSHWEEAISIGPYRASRLISFLTARLRGLELQLASCYIVEAEQQHQFDTDKLKDKPIDPTDNTHRLAFRGLTRQMLLRRHYPGAMRIAADLITFTPVDNYPAWKLRIISGHRALIARECVRVRGQLERAKSVVGDILPTIN